MLGEFLIMLFEASIAMSVIALVYIAITPLLRKKFAAKGRYYAWLVIVIGLIIPFRFHPRISAIYMNPLIPAVKPTNNYTLESYVSVVSTNISWSVLVGGLWLVGVTVFITIHVIRHRRFLRLIKRWSIKSNNEQVLNILHDLQVKLRIEKQVELQVCPGISSPMLIGFFRHTILLPTDNIPVDELSLILKHELIHLKRRDVWYKAFVFVATAMHWFNPFVYMIAREISIQCEISCDEEVVKNIKVDERQKYVEAIIGVIRKQVKMQSKFSTHFYSGKQGMKHRIFSIMDTSNKKWGFSIMVIVFMATLSTGMLLKISTPENSLKHSVFPSENELGQKSLHDVEIGVARQSLSEKDNSVLEKNNDTSHFPKDVFFIIDEEESTLKTENPKLVEGQ